MYDVIVVGARCAGAATAMLLARQGHKALMVDQATFPSDIPQSTHLLWHAGTDLLHKWGLLDAVRESNCPALTQFTLDLGEMTLQGTPPGALVGEAFGPRRIVLDQILLDAALAAGAELREQVSFDGVLTEAGRVVGIKAKQADGSAFEVRARLVIGADGRTSPVARAVNSEVYNEVSKKQGSCNTYAYFSGLPVKGVEFISTPERMAYAWQTNDKQVIVGVIHPARDCPMGKSQAEAWFYSSLKEMSPSLSTRVRAARRESDWMNIAIGTFCRKPVGPGWALVGDAGLTMDPITAGGMTNALRDAELLSGLVHQGLSSGGSMDEALAGFEEQRNAVSLPLYQFTQQMAQLAPPTEEVFQLFGALAGNQVETDRYFGVFAQTVSPADFFDPTKLAQLIAPSSSPT